MRGDGRFSTSSIVKGSEQMGGPCPERPKNRPALFGRPSPARARSPPSAGAHLSRARPASPVRAARRQAVGAVCRAQDPSGRGIGGWGVAIDRQEISRRLVLENFPGRLPDDGHRRLPWLPRDLLRVLAIQNAASAGKAHSSSACSLLPVVGDQRLERVVGFAIGDAEPFGAEGLFLPVGIEAALGNDPAKLDGRMKLAGPGRGRLLRERLPSRAEMLEAPSYPCAAYSSGVVT